MNLAASKSVVQTFHKTVFCILTDNLTLIIHFPLSSYYTKNKKVYIHEEEGPIVKEIFERYAAGERGNEIAISFAERGILYRGKPFSSANIYIILHAEKYTGRYVLHGEVYGNIYPRIIEPELFERCKQRI